MAYLIECWTITLISLIAGGVAILALIVIGAGIEQAYLVAKRWTKAEIDRYLSKLRDKQC